MVVTHTLVVVQLIRPAGHLHAGFSLHNLIIHQTINIREAIRPTSRVTTRI